MKAARKISLVLGISAAAGTGMAVTAGSAPVAVQASSAPTADIAYAAFSLGWGANSVQFEGLFVAPHKAVVVGSDGTTDMTRPWAMFRSSKLNASGTSASETCTYAGNPSSQSLQATTASFDFVCEGTTYRLVLTADGPAYTASSALGPVRLDKTWGAMVGSPTVVHLGWIDGPAYYTADAQLCTPTTGGTWTCSAKSLAGGFLTTNVAQLSVQELSQN